MADRTALLRDAIVNAIEGLYRVNAIPRLFIDPRVNGVLIPEHVRERWSEGLPIDLRPEWPLNLEHGTDALYVDLAFGGVTMRCTFPWASIRAVCDIHTGQGMLIDAPPAAKPQEVAQPAQRPSLRLVKGGKA